MKKTILILTTILIMSLITTMYGIIIAPMLEPDSRYQKEDLPRNGSRIPPQQIMTLFNPSDWEINSSRHLHYNNTHLFFGDYTIRAPETVSFDKCTIVFIVSSNPLKAILIQCMDEITLNFEKPITHGFKDDNRILGGMLTGKILVTSKGDEDIFRFETQDFNIDKDRIWTKANVLFKYGTAQGMGTGMEIQLINHGLFGSTQKSNTDSAVTLPRIENITIQKLQRLTIVPPAKKQTEDIGNQPVLFNEPIELSCDGPFVFNALSKSASFTQNVSLIQTVSNRASNSIRCQSLTLFFSPINRNKPVGDSTQKSDSDFLPDEWDLQLDRLEAIGLPVVIEAPEYQTKIHASKFVATLSPLSFELESSTQCELYYKNHRISTQNLVYTIGENGELGTLDCSSGWISSQMEQSGKQIRARWSDRLRLEPDRSDPTESIVSIKGSARLEIENKNVSEAAITADGIFFWLTQKSESQGSNKLSELTISRMQADKNVVLTSRSITANVNTMQLWFEELVGQAQESSSEMQATSQSAGQLRGNADDALRLADSQLASQSYSVTGDLLQGKVLLGQGQFQISELTLKDGVRVVQNSSNPNAKVKLEMNGSQIRIFNLTLPSATASLIGQPAKIRYNNTVLSGTVINVNRETNRIWIESGGKALFMPDSGELEAPNAENPALNSQSAMGPAKIEWSKSMNFQNDTLTFAGDVSLQRKDQYAQCDNLSITLNKKIDFQNLDSTELLNSLEVRFIELNNSVKLENITAENGVTVAMDCLTAAKLTIDMKNQMFTAEGPGRAMTQRKNPGQTGESSDENAQAPQQPLSQLSAANNSPLINMSVNFQRRLDGSFDTRTPQTFTFSGYVVAVYSPIDEIGKPIRTFNISELPPQAFTLKCEQMEIQTQLGSNASPSRNSSFIASNGVSIEGLVYNASADKITFEAKNGMLTLEGDGQIPAQFFYQKVQGGRYSKAVSSVIHYNTQTGAVQGEGIQEFSLFLSPKNKPE